MQNHLSALINERFQIWSAHHMTHLENLRSILEHGGLKSHNRMKKIDHRSIANDRVQSGRAKIIVPGTELSLHDYVPLYLGFKTPMVAYLQDKNEDLVFLIFSLNILEIRGSMLTDGNARSNATKFYLFRDIEDFSNLDIKTIRSERYAQNAEVKRKKQAEVLIPDQLPLNHLHHIICYNEKRCTHINSLLKLFGFDKRAIVNRAWYFDPKKVKT